MEILVNGKTYTFDYATLGELLREMNLHERRGVAVALNGQIVPGTAWKDQVVQPADRITVIQATAGG